MQNQDFYSTDDGSSNDEGQASDASSGDASQDKDSNSALLPKSLFGTTVPDVGSEVSLRVVHVYGDEIEVEAMNDKTKKPSAMNDAEDRLGKMSTMNDGTGGDGNG